LVYDKHIETSAFYDFHNLELSSAKKWFIKSLVVNEAFLNSLTKMAKMWLTLTEQSFI